MQTERGCKMRWMRGLLTFVSKRKSRSAVPSLSAAAAGSGTLCRCALALAAGMLSFSAAACGNERPPWSGFDLFPGDAGGIELSPQVQSGLEAAAAAFLAQIAAGAGAGTGAAAGASASGAGAAAASAAGTGAERLPPMAAATEERAGNGANADEQQKPAATADAGAPKDRGASNAGRASPSGWPPWLPRLDAGIPRLPGTGQQMGPPQLDAGTSEPDADGGE